MASTAALALACTVFVAALVLSEARGWRAARGATKLLASSCFVALAWLLDAAESAYGRWILVALLLSWLGDALLLSRRSRVFLTGIGAFLLAHVAFALAFTHVPLDRIAVLVGMPIFALLGAGILRWLWPHLAALYRRAVPAYVLAIMAMCTLAVAAGFGGAGTWVPLAALVFAASDVSVARDRFVAPGFVNKAWGLPLYYAAQLLLAASVAGNG